MDSIGSGEILLVAIVALLALDPRTVGRWWNRLGALKRRLGELRSELASEVEGEEPAEAAPARRTPQQRLRDWARKRVEALGQTEIDRASTSFPERLRGWDAYRTATDVAAFWPLRGEPPLESLLRAVLADGKRLWLPRLGEGAGIMEMLPVSDLDGDLAEGRWGLREPKPGSRVDDFPQGALVLVPGSVFDLHGGRIGKGGGYYDRWLAAHPDAVATGCCWDAQVHPGRLPMEAHDVPMRHLLTELRLATFRGE
jgi:5-formyltetrahydrofolate cyclo-ligase